MFEQGYYEKLGYERFKTYADYRAQYESLASISQISFLLGLIADYKFSNGRKIENVLEIGLYNGVTSLYMLKEGCKNTENYKQYGIDIGNDSFFGEAAQKESTEEEKQHFFLNLNSTALDIEKCIPVGTKLDMVFIDAGHSHPHPLIDLLCVIPYLHDESIVLLHDVVDYMRPNAWGESFIFEAWKYPKYRNINVFAKDIKEEELGMIEIPKDKNKLQEMLLTVAQLPFRAAPWKFDEIYLGINENTIKRLEEFMQRYYEKDFCEQIIKSFYTNLENYKKEWVLRVHETRFYDYLFYKGLNFDAEIKKLKQNNDIAKNEIENIITELNVLKQRAQYTFLQKIFSVKNINTHKVFTVFGIKFKFRRRGV